MEEVRAELLNEAKRIECIKFKGNLSASGPDGITFSILNIEKEKAASVLVTLMIFLLNWKKFRECWNSAKTFLFNKGGLKEDPANWCLISLTNAIYRVDLVDLLKCFKLLGKKDVS
jgi:hypothetical protein